MAAIITSAIPKQSFEVIRDQIGAVLQVELNEQHVIDPAFVVPGIWVERIVELGHTEIPAINIAYSSGKRHDKSRRGVDMDNVYLIDVYTSAPTTGTDKEERGDVKAMVSMQQIMGRIMAILDNPNYDTLGLEAGIITNTAVTEARIMDKGSGTDMLSTVVGRIFFTVGANENFSAKEGVPLGNAITKAKLGLTDKGFKYEIEI